ncbi:hypothetical protein SPHFLASMR4Y_01751 [Sphingorhabdus sp. SMR4y]|nr:hypothetical protein SPHFLASMR4Y_01751 [Sphingorhabdus sp. SMR4y]
MTRAIAAFRHGDPMEALLILAGIFGTAVAVTGLAVVL